MSIESQLSGYLKKLSGNVSFKRFYPEKFLKQHTKFMTIYDFFGQANISNQNDVDAWSESDRDSFVQNFTDFESWDDMYTTAGKEFVSLKQQALRKGIWKDEQFNSDNQIDNIHIYINFVG